MGPKEGYDATQEIKFRVQGRGRRAGLMVIGQRQVGLELNQIAGQNEAQL